MGTGDGGTDFAICAPSISSCFIFILGNTINGGTYVPVAFIQVTTVIRFHLSADVREATSFLLLKLTTLLRLCCTVLIPVSSTLNILGD